VFGLWLGSSVGYIESRATRDLGRMCDVWRGLDCRNGRKRTLPCSTVCKPHPAPFKLSRQNSWSPYEIEGACFLQDIELHASIFDTIFSSEPNHFMWARKHSADLRDCPGAEGQFDERKIRAQTSQCWLGVWPGDLGACSGRQAPVQRLMFPLRSSKMPSLISPQFFMSSLSTSVGLSDCNIQLYKVSEFSYAWTLPCIERKLIFFQASIGGAGKLGDHQSSRRQAPEPHLMFPLRRNSSALAYLATIF
jgi:hypothetical protein